MKKILKLLGDYDEYQKSGGTSELIAFIDEDLLDHLKDNRIGDSNADSSAVSSFLRKLEAVQLLLEDGRADPTARNNAAIRCAALNGNHEVAQLLLNDARLKIKGMSKELQFLITVSKSMSKKTNSM